LLNQLAQYHGYKKAPLEKGLLYEKWKPNKMNFKENKIQNTHQYVISKTVLKFG